jgi:hypothetical protein
MILPDEIKAEIKEIFTPPGEELSDSEVQEIANNLTEFTLSLAPKW